MRRGLQQVKGPRRDWPRRRRRRASLTILHPLDLLYHHCLHLCPQNRSRQRQRARFPSLLKRKRRCLEVVRYCRFQSPRRGQGCTKGPQRISSDSAHDTRNLGGNIHTLGTLVVGTQASTAETVLRDTMRHAESIETTGTGSGRGRPPHISLLLVPRVPLHLPIAMKNTDYHPLHP